jgi:hypothetical protein
MGQYTKLNLKNVCTVSKGTPPTKPCGYGKGDLPCDPCQDNGNVLLDPDTTNPFYFDKTIDPLGELFGYSQCGELNYTGHMVFYPPTK